MSQPQQIQHVPPDEVYGYLDSRPQGLTSQEIEERLLEVGKNTMEVRDRWKWVRTLTKQFVNFFTILLNVSAVICFVADSIQPGESMDVLGWALLGVSFLNAFFSFVQEYRAEKAMEALRKFLPPRVWVRREEKNIEILADDLVPGDVLIVSEGDRIAADGRLVKCDDLVVDNSPLTGESKAQSLKESAVNKRMTESENLVFAGCSVLKGSGEAVIFATGIRTEFGKLAHLSQSIRRSPSPLEIETGRLVKILTIIAVSMGFSFFLYGVFSGRSLWVNLVFMMGIIVANVPEGLLPTFTLSLAIGSMRMAKKNVLVKELKAVEALGSVHVICTDKTGTLTHNQLTITHLGDAAACERLDNNASEQFLLELALSASEVRTSKKGFSGDPLDIAIANAYVGKGGKFDAFQKGVEKYFAFDVDKRRSGGIYLVGPEKFFAVKGAWEAIRPLVANMRPDLGGDPVPADDEALEKAEAAMTKVAAQGLRVIVVAYRTLSRGDYANAKQDDLEQNLILAGFMGVEDPIRKEVPPAVRKCHTAGIDVIMITGDHPDTALAIARKSGILAQDANEARALTGDVLEQLTQEQLMEELQKGVSVFARTTPEQKMKIVAALKEMDKVVAMTGDGVNDAPALKAADVGVAMGKKGTDVARESAQIVLLDDNFASIVAGVEEGRAIFSNIKKFTNYVLVSNGPEILPYLIYILFPVPLALTVIQILSIDLGTDIIPSMGLGQEPPDPEEMGHPPRDRSDGLLTPPLIIHSYLFLGLLEALWSISLFFLVLVKGGWEYGAEIASNDALYQSATGIALSTILLMQIGNLLGRRFAYRSGLDVGIVKNKLIFLGIIIQMVFSWAVLYFPLAQKALSTAPVSIEIYFLAWLGIPLIFGLDYIRKKIAQRLHTARERPSIRPRVPS